LCIRNLHRKRPIRSMARAALRTVAFLRIMSTAEEGGRLDGRRQIINLGIAVVALGATAALIVAAWVNRFDPVLSDLVVKNFAAIIGLPFAFIASFVVVALFRKGTGPIEFDGDFTSRVRLGRSCFGYYASSRFH
jgi:hypothetical protein